MVEDDDRGAAPLGQARLGGDLVLVRRERKQDAVCENHRRVSRLNTLREVFASENRQLPCRYRRIRRRMTVERPAAITAFLEKRRAQFAD
jgi:hypothetical protein